MTVRPLRGEGRLHNYNIWKFGQFGGKVGLFGGGGGGGELPLCSPSPQIMKPCQHKVRPTVSRVQPVNYSPDAIINKMGVALHVVMKK